VRAESRHLGISIARPARDVYDYVSNPANLPAWAAGLGSSVREVDGHWTADSPMGRILVAFAEPNDFGVLDHDVTLPSGEVVNNPMRVIADDPGCEIVFSLRRRPGMSDRDFASDADAVARDLAVLKGLLERS
jgi:hypothetical protein